MAHEKKRRILRIGIIQGGKIVEERLLRKRETITVGQAPRNTFIISSASLPRSYPLFEVKAGGYQLIFNKQMEGRCSVGSEIVDLKALGRSGQAARRGGDFVLPLDDSSRGKVVIGDLTFLFQFVDPPPVLPKPQLPAAAKAGVSQQLDWTFVYILIIVGLILAGGGVGADIWWRMVGQYTEGQYRRKNNPLYETLKAEVIQDKEKEEEKEPEEDDDAAGLAEGKGKDEGKADDAPAPEEQPKEKKKVKRSKGPKTRESKTKKQIRAAVRRKTILHVVGSMDGEGGFLQETLSKASSHVPKAFDGLGDGVGLADRDGAHREFIGTPKLKQGGGTRYKALSGKEVGGGRIKTKKVVTAPKEKRKEKRISMRYGSLSGKTGTGAIDRNKVSRVFSRRKGAIKYCYEKALKTNPNIKGKVGIRFTIGTAGRITRITVTSNTTGNPGVATCIVTKVKTWRFPPAEGGAVTFSHSFVLSAS